MKPILVIGGPTAAGKTAIALEIAQRWEAVVLSADAMQVYRGMDIGTAKPTPEERARVPHEGLDLVAPTEPFDVASFLALAERVLKRWPRVVVAGGTSLYLHGLRRGLVETPPPDPEVRAELEALDDPHRHLAAVDPQLAARLHPSDRKRVIRGLEVWRQTGRPLSELQAEHAARPDRYALKGLWLERSDLDERIDARVLQMMDAGYLEEVEGLLRDVPPDAKPMRSLGYRHLVAHLLNGLSLDETIRRTQRDTRRFARKQRTWQRTLRFRAVSADRHLEVAREAAERVFGPR